MIMDIPIINNDLPITFAITKTKAYKDVHNNKNDLLCQVIKKRCPLLPDTLTLIAENDEITNVLLCNEVIKLIQ